MLKVTADHFADAVSDILQVDYFSKVNEATREVIPQVAKEAAKRLRKASPKGRTGDYAKGWASSVDNGRMRVGATVYGKHGTYQLAHLLEYGHATRNGGRTGANEHIKPVEEWAVEEVQDQIMKTIEGI